MNFVYHDAFVATGSDCGNLFIWEKQSGEIVQVLRADKNVVNGITYHPGRTALGVCGIDSDAKIFDVGGEITTDVSYAMKMVNKNSNDTKTGADSFGGNRRVHPL